MVLGGGAGKLKGGRHVKFTDKPSMANLLMTLMDKMDVLVERIGGSTGKVQLDTLSLCRHRCAARRRAGLRAGSTVGRRIDASALGGLSRRPREDRPVASCGANVNATNDLGATPLWAASINGNVALIKRLLDAGANPNTALVSGETPLMVAARSGKAAAVQALLDKAQTRTRKGRADRRR